MSISRIVGQSNGTNVVINTKLVHFVGQNAVKQSI